MNFFDQLKKKKIEHENDPIRIAREEQYRKTSVEISAALHELKLEADSQNVEFTYRENEPSGWTMTYDEATHYIDTGMMMTNRHFYPEKSVKEFIQQSLLERYE